MGEEGTEEWGEEAAEEATEEAGEVEVEDGKLLKRISGVENRKGF